MSHALTSHRNYKQLQCVSCPTDLRVDVNATMAQCGQCLMSSKPRPKGWFQDEAEAHQLELGEATT